MFLDVGKRARKRGVFVLTQNLVILIIILALAGIVGYVLFKFATKNLTPFG